MRLPVLGGKPQQIIVQCKNGEASADIGGTGMGPGIPVVLTANGTDDGLSVVLSSTAAANQLTSLGYGIAPVVIKNGQIGDVVMFGVVLSAKLVLQTRSASTAAWASWVAGATGDALIPETVNNGLKFGFSGSSMNASAVQPPMVAMQSWASGTTQASSFTLAGASTTVSALYMNLRIFVRSM